MRLLASVSVVTCAGVLTSACTDTVGVPSRSPGPLTASVTSTGPASYPNSQKYRDAGYHPATGRSGDAAIAMRALLGSSGMTDVEVTTGTFDDGAAPGTLASVQVKGYTPSGAVFFTDNYTGLANGGTARFPYSGLARGTVLQVQTAVRSIDGQRTDIVTVTDAVRLRPDLVALRLEGPAEAPVGAAVNFTAFVMERHGELGARASCVLYLDGAETDRADGIWVDAGGMVACAMTHTFTTAGTHALELRIENVLPADYDDTNNRVTASIDIVAPAEFAVYSFQAWSTVDSTWWRAVSTFTLPDGTVETWDQTYTREGPFQYSSLNGLIARSLAFPITMQGEMATNGATVNVLDLTHETGEWVDWQQGHCANTYSFSGGAVTYVCVYAGGGLAGYTYVQYDWWGADVRYHSDSYVRSWDPSGELQERWISSDWTQEGPMVTFGPDFSGRLLVQGAGDSGPTTAEATVPLSPVTIEFDYADPGCSETPVSTSCFEIHVRTVGVTGFVSYGSWP